MKKTFSLAYLILVLVITALGQTPRTVPPAYTSPFTVNYVRSWQAIAPDTDPNHLIGRTAQDVQQSTVYYDGLGRPIQTVIKDISPSGKDFVRPILYDNMGREQFRYLSFPSTTGVAGDNLTDGNFKADPYQQQAAFYTGTAILSAQGNTFFYGQSVYEASPMGRLTTAYAAGNAWIGATKGAQLQYYTNTLADSVQKWTLTASYATIPNTTQPIPANAGGYPAGKLFKKISSDEAGNKVEEYKDMEGKIVLKRVQAVATPSTGHAGWLNTYYIFDNLNNLRYVLQPQAVQLLQDNATWNLSTVPNLLAGLTYYYEYDNRDRMIIKQMPGVKPVYIVYDARDRVVMSQDGNMRTTGKWLVNVYDLTLNRPVQTGLLTNAGSLATHIAAAANVTNYPSTATGFELLTQTWYDNYTWQAGTPLSGGFDATQATATGFKAASDVTYPYARAVAVTSFSTIGKVTGTKNEVLGTSTYLYNASYYDDHDRVIQNQGINITGSIDETTNQYAFDGKVLVSQVKSVKSGTNAQTNTIQSQNSYDNAGRLTNITKNFTGAFGSPVTKNLVTNTYNELGQLLTKTVGPVSGAGGGPVDRLTYDYNIRGWPLGIDRNYINSVTTIAGTNALPAPGNYFGEELAYDKLTSVSGMTYALAELNGNVAGTVWKSTGDAINRKYNFTYDNANRLIGAAFAQVTPTNAETLDFSVSGLSYDANGNIKSMTQKGYRLGSPTAAVDVLTYTYLPASNQLKNVLDGANNPQTILGDFRSSQAYMTALGGTKTIAATDYSYDDNGNLATDLNKDIGTSAVKGITFNYLNLPLQVTYAGTKGNTQYKYDAAGTKLQKITTENSGSVTYNGTTYSGVAVVTTTSYLNGFIFQSVAYTNNATLNASLLAHGDILQTAETEAGRIRGLYYNTTNSNTLTGYAFDYFEKDHLGNTRVILTDEAYTDPAYQATMEAANAPAEQKIFKNISPTAKPAGFDANGANVSVSLVNNYAAAPQKIGPSMVLKVMAGDQLSISVQAFYQSASGNNYAAYTLAAADILTNLVSGMTTAGGIHGTLTDVQNNSAVLNASTQTFLTSRTPPNTGVPKAYLNYVFLDDQFRYAGGYSSPVTSAAATAAIALQGNPQPVFAPKNGFVYVYVSNESNYNVYFDNLTVTFKRGPLLEDNAYYPFGLSMAGISDKAIKPNYADNRFRFAGKELQSGEFTDGSGLEEYDFGPRQYDAQIGRFNQVDLLTEYMRRWSPYTYGFNNPVRFADISGMDPTDSIAKPPPPPSDEPKGKLAEVKTLEEVTIHAGGKKKKDDFWNGLGHLLSSAVDFIPFAGSIKQIAVGIYDGDWKEAALGVVMLGVDVVTAGEGGEAIRLGEKGLQVLAENETKEVIEKGIENNLEKDVVDEGIIYERVNPKTGERYIGQTKSDERFLERQTEHDTKLGVKHNYEILERGKPGKDLSVKEENHIRLGGGPKNKGGSLANKRYQMSEKNYRAAGGKIDKPTN